MDGMRDPYPALSPGEWTALRRIGGGLGKYAQLYHAYTLVALELVAFDPEGRLVATEAGHQWLRDAECSKAQASRRTPTRLGGGPPTIGLISRESRTRYAAQTIWLEYRAASGQPE